MIASCSLLTMCFTVLLLTSTHPMMDDVYLPSLAAQVGTLRALRSGLLLIHVPALEAWHILKPGSVSTTSGASCTTARHRCSLSHFSPLKGGKRRHTHTTEQ